MKIKGYDLIMVDYDFYIYKSNLENKKLLYDKTDKIFINSNYDSGTLGETIDSSDYKIYSINDIECLEVATTENVRRLDSSWVLPDKKPNLDNNTENLGVVFGLIGIIGDTVIRGYEEWYIIKFKDGKKAIFGSMSNRVKKIIGEIKL